MTPDEIYDQIERDCCTHAGIVSACPTCYDKGIVVYLTVDGPVEGPCPDCRVWYDDLRGGYYRLKDGKVLRDE